MRICVISSFGTLSGDNVLKDYAVVQEVAVEIEVRWSELLTVPMFSLLAIEMDGAAVAKLKSPPQEGRAILGDFNFGHPLLQPMFNQDQIAEEDRCRRPR